MKSRQTLIIGLAIALIVLIGAAVWYVVAQNDTEQPITNGSASTEPAQARLATPQADYKGTAVTSFDNSFALVVPSGWSPVMDCSNSPVIYVGESEQTKMEYDESTDATVVEGTCGSDSLSLFFATKNSAKNANDSVENTQPFTTTAGLAGTKACNSNVASAGIAADVYLQQCVYEFKKDDSVYTITYTQPDQSYVDRTELIDRVAKSLVVQ